LQQVLPLHRSVVEQNIPQTESCEPYYWQQFLALRARFKAVAYFIILCGPSILQGDTRFLRGGKRFLQGGKRFLQGGKRFLWGGKRFLWGDTRFLRGGKRFLRGGKRFLWGDTRFLRGGKRFLREDACPSRATQIYHSLSTFWKELAAHRPHAPPARTAPEV
jgi:hypothetical protein